MSIAIEKRDDLRQRLENMTLEAWKLIKPSFLEELYELPTHVVRDILEATPLKRNITTRDARLRVLCCRTIRRKNAEEFARLKTNPNYGRF